MSEQSQQPFTIDEVMQHIKDAKSMKEMDALRMECVRTMSQEVTLKWQKKYHGMKCFRKPIDRGYKYDYSKKDVI